MSAAAEALRAVIFDAVGTLIELREPVGESYARRARAEGVDLPADRIEEAFGRIWRRADPMPWQSPAAERAWWQQLVRDTFRAADQSARFRDFEGCFEGLWRHFGGAGAWRLRPGVREGLLALRRRGLARAVVSNFDGRLPHLLDELGVLDLLDTVVLPGDAGARKPDPRIFHCALERLGLPAEAALYVGDDPERDVAGARAAGLRAVQVGSLAKLHAVTRQVDPEPSLPGPR